MTASVYRQFTFPWASDAGGRGGVRACLGWLHFTDTFDVNLFRLPQFATVIALSDRAAFLLDLVERTVDVLAVG